MPTLNKYDEKMQEMSLGYEQSMEMIRRYDEVITEKANKLAIKEVYEHLPVTYVKSKSYDEEYSLHKSQIEQLFEEAKQMKENLQVITENIGKDIHAAVRRATTTLKA